MKTFKTVENKSSGFGLTNIEIGVVMALFMLIVLIGTVLKYMDMLPKYFILYPFIPSIVLAKVFAYFNKKYHNNYLIELISYRLLQPAETDLKGQPKTYTLEEVRKLAENEKKKKNRPG